MKSKIKFFILCYFLILFIQNAYSAEIRASNRQTLNYPVLLIHGLNSNEKTWNSIIKEMSSRGYIYGGNFIMKKNGDYEIQQNNNWSIGDIYTVRLSSNDNLTFREQGKELKICIDRILDSTERKKMILVGHSMGGLAVRAYISFYNVNNNVSGLITIGTPHAGSILAYARDFINENKNASGFSKLTSGSFKNTNEIAADMLKLFSNFFINLNSKAVEYLKPDSDELIDLNKQYVPDNIKYINIISDWKSGESISYKKSVDYVVNNYLNAYNNYYSKSEQAQKISGSIHKKNHDGVVSVISQYMKSAGYIYNNDSMKNIDVDVVFIDAFHSKETAESDIIIEAIEKISPRDNISGDIILTTEKYKETSNLSIEIANKYGKNYRLIDWNDLKSINNTNPAKFEKFLDNIGITEDCVLLLSVNNKRFFMPKRHYYVHRSTDGLPYKGFAVHDRIGSLYLGSWFNLNMNVLIIQTN